jgi:hypothetical protein
VASVSFGVVYESGFVAVLIVTGCVAMGAGAGGNAAFLSFPKAKELAAATLPATARNCLRLTFEGSQLLDMVLSLYNRDFQA